MYKENNFYILLKTEKLVNLVLVSEHRFLFEENMKSEGERGKSPSDGETDRIR